MFINRSSRVQIQIIVFVAHERFVAFKLRIGLRYISLEELLAIFRRVRHILCIVVVIWNI